MMGDREKCIQAQMDEYLSKPLQQNHLIQTILKCATLGGALLEKNREREAALAAAEQQAAGSGSVADSDAAVAAKKDQQAAASAAMAAAGLRPSLGERAFTAIDPIGGAAPLDSPALVSADSDDPLHRVRRLVSEP